MGRRLDFHEILKEILGSSNVYFQPDSNIRMQYPAIVYELSDLESRHANNDPYTISTAYLVTHIDRNADSEVPMKLARLRYSDFDRPYRSDGLYHNVFEIYY